MKTKGYTISSICAEGLFLKIIVFICIIIETASGISPTVIVTGDTTMEVNFAAVLGADKYIVTHSQKHGARIIENTTTETSMPINDLIGSTLYDISVKAENSAGDILEQGTTAAQTHPSPPTVHTNTIPLPNVILLFFDTPNKARVSQWTVEYSEFGSSAVNTTTTEPGRYYAHGLSNLLANTVYEVRARASQINSVKDLTESESVFSEWQNVTSGLLDLFGRADLVKVNYTAEQSIDNSAEQNLILANLQDAYLNKPNGGIRILEVGVSPNLTGKARVYFEIKILDTQLPTSTDFSLPATDYEYVAVDNTIPDAEPTGPAIVNGIAEFSLSYQADSTAAKVEIGATVTREDASTVKISLVVTKSDEGQDDITDFGSQRVKIGSKQPADSDHILINVTANKVVGMTPEFLVRENNDVYKVYRDNLYLDDFITRASSWFFTTELDASILNINDVTYVSASGGTEVTITIPAVEKAIRYDIINGSKSIASLEGADIDGSDKVKITVPSLEKGTTYTFNIGVTTRTNEGRDDTYSEYQIDATPTIDECKQDTLNNCHPNATCIETIESFECSCNSGYSGNGTHCQDIDECNNVTLHGCHANATCNNTDGSYICTCNSGYSGKGTDCSDVDECKNITINNCHANATCNNTDGNYICTCNSGYSGNGTSCSDIDECKNSTFIICHANATCNNTDGSYICTCNPGYSGKGTDCSDVDECKNITINNCHANATCNNTDGSYICTCNSGYSGNGTSCSDIDECKNSTFIICHANATCNNTDGSYICTCNPGYSRKGTYCPDIDECKNSTINNCHANATCNNTDGSYTCTCNSGYSGNGFFCKDIDECTNNSLHDCNYSAKCINSPGSFSCMCNLGFVGNGTFCQLQCSVAVFGTSLQLNCENITNVDELMLTANMTPAEDIISHAACEDIAENEKYFKIVVTDTVTFIQNLVPGTTYNIVLKYIVNGNSTFIFNDTYKIESYATPSPTFSVEKDSIFASWHKPYGGTEYLIDFTCIDNDHDDTRMETTTNPMITFDSLLPGRHYNVCITLLLCEARAVGSVPTCNDTLTLPARPTIIFITHTNNTTSLKWEVTRGTMFTRIVLKAFNATGRRKRDTPIVYVKNNFWEGTVNGSSVDIRGLDAGQEFDLDVIPGNSAGEGESSSTTFLVPTNVNETNVPPNPVTDISVITYTDVPTTAVTGVPTTKVTNVPTTEVTHESTTAFTDVPTTAVTNAPTTEVTNVPTTAFTDAPTTGVTTIPTTEVTHAPTTEVTNVPTTEVTHVSTTEVTYVSTTEVTYVPTTEVTYVPTTAVTRVPTTEVTNVPTTEVTYVPTTEVTYVPTTEVTYVPTTEVTYVPTTEVTYVPTTEVTYVPECVFDSSQDEDFNPTFLNITESSISVVWQDIPNVETYTISVHCVNCGNDTRSVGTSSTNVANFISLQPGSTYEVCLTVDLCNAGIRNPTTRCSETTLVPPAITNVNKTVAALFVVLNWESVPGAKHYVVSFVILNTGKRRKRSTGVLTAWSDPVSSTTYKTSNILSGTTYKYSVAATNDAGTGISFEDDFTTEIPTTPKKMITHQPIEISTPEPTREIIFQSVTTSSKITDDESSATIKSTPDMRLNTTTKKDSSRPSAIPNTSDNPSSVPNKIVTTYPQSTASSTKDMIESTREISTLTDTTKGQPNTTKQTEYMTDITERSSSERGTLTITTDFQPTGTRGIINEGFPRWLIGVIILVIIFIIVSVIAVVIYCRRKQQGGRHVALGI